MTTPSITARWAHAFTQEVDRHNLPTHAVIYVCTMIAYYFNSINTQYTHIIDDNIDHIASTVVTHLVSEYDTTDDYKNTIHFLYPTQGVFFHYQQSVDKQPPYDNTPNPLRDIITVNAVSQDITLAFPVPIMDYVFAHRGDNVDTWLSCILLMMDCHVLTYNDFPVVKYIVDNMEDLHDFPPSWVLSMSAPQ